MPQDRGRSCSSGRQISVMFQAENDTSRPQWHGEFLASSK